MTEKVWSDWNDTNWGKSKDSKKILSQCHFVYHDSHVDWLGIWRGPPYRDSDDNIIIIIVI